ncbi:phage portal protein family protein, partial [Escherichia coli]
MPRGIYVTPTEFVSFSETTKSLSDQIAVRSRSIDFYGLGMYLPNPDPILKAQGRDIKIYRELRSDPLVGGCIRRRKAAVKALENGVERGNATARVFRFVRDLFDDLDISRITGEMTDAVLYGYQPCELMWSRDGKSWAVTDVVGKPPEWFQFDMENRLRFRARNAGLEGELTPPYKFLLPRQDATYDNPYGFPD